MGSWDCYCAICGGPFWGATVSGKPRTAAFLRRRAKELENQRLGKKCADDEHNECEGDDGDGDEGSHARYDEEHSYDRDVVSEEDLQWAKTLHVLAFNAESEGESKAFVSGPGCYNDYGSVLVESGDDPNAEDFDLDMPACYHNFLDGSHVIFPFHWCCYEVLAKCLTGSFNDDDLDKDLVYGIMRELAPSCGSSLSIAYGDVRFMQGQFWEILAGYEYVVSHPRNVPGADEVVLSILSSDAFKTKPSCTDLRNRVRHDPFARTPYDIIYRISKFISDQELVNLARASWPVHALLRDNNQFWRQRLRASIFPWFFELRELLEQGQTLSQTNNAQRIFHWADWSTRPRKWLTGPLMGVANRRRIWTVCEKLGEMYWSLKEDKDDVSKSDEERLIRRDSEVGPLITVSSPEATELNPARKVFWAKSWSETQSQGKTLEGFWDHDGSLVGISLTPDGQERRLLGLAGSGDDGVRTESTRLGPGEWIKALIVHVPVPTDSNNSQLTTSPKGLTIILDSGRRPSIGDTSQSHMQRFLSAGRDWYITGVSGTTGFVMGNLQLTQLALVQAEHPDVADHTVPHRVRLPAPTPLGQVMWDKDYSQILGQGIWEHPTLRLVGCRNFLQSKSHLHRDLVSHEALIWAKDVGEQRALRRLTGCIVSGGNEDLQFLCGVIAEYGAPTDLARRAVGLEKTGAGPSVTPTALSEPFDIDGPGGEVVTELELPVQDYPKALKIHTNRGRACSWGETGVRVHRWDSLKAPTGEALVGIVVKSEGLGRCRNDGAEGVWQYEMSVVGGLSMPIQASTMSKPAWKGLFWR